MALQQRSQQQQHIGQAIMQQQQQSGRLTSYQQSQSQVMKIPETTYLQPQHLPPIEQRVQGTTTIPQQQQSHPLQSKNVTSTNLPPYYSSRNAAGTANFAPSQISLQQQQQHLILHQQQTSDNMQNITNAVNAGSVHAISQLSDLRQQVVQAAPTQQQATQLVAQSHLQQQQQSINYGSSMITPTCSATAVVAAQTVAAASQQLDLNKQMSLSATPLQESISSGPYDLYAYLPKKPATGAVQPQHQQQVVFTNSFSCFSLRLV